jgi:hypothetical protein
VTRRFFWSGQIARGRLIGTERRREKLRPVRSRGVRRQGQTVGGRIGVGGSFLGDVRSRSKRVSHMGRR